MLKVVAAVAVVGAAWQAAGPTPASATEAGGCVVTAASITSRDGTAIVSDLLDVTPITLSFTTLCEMADGDGHTILVTGGGLNDFTVTGNCTAAVLASNDPDIVGTLTGASVWDSVVLGWAGQYNSGAVVFTNMCNKTSATLAQPGAGVNVRV